MTVSFAERVYRDDWSVKVQSLNLSVNEGPFGYMDGFAPPGQRRTAWLPGEAEPL